LKKGLKKLTSGNFEKLDDLDQISENIKRLDDENSLLNEKINKILDENEGKKFVEEAFRNNQLANLGDEKNSSSVKSLEIKVFKKFELMEEKIKKHDHDFLVLKNDSHASKNNSDNLFKSISLNSESIDGMKKQLEELINNIKFNEKLDSVKINADNEIKKYYRFLYKI